MPGKKILVTTDGSTRSLRVFPHAASFAAASGAELAFLRVFKPTTKPGEAPDAIKQSADRARGQLEGILRRSGIRGTAMATPALAGEDVAAAILRVAHDERAGLLAMCSRGRGIVSRALFGSVVTSVLGRSRLPVMIAGPKVEFAPAEEPYRVLLASDGTAASGQVLEVLRPLLESSRIGLVLLRVHLPTLGDHGEEEEVQLCQEQLDALRESIPPSVEVETRVETKHKLGGPEDVIVAAAVRDANAIAFATHGHSMAHDILVGSVGLKMVRRSPLPVILARPD